MRTFAIEKGRPLLGQSGPVVAVQESGEITFSAWHRMSLRELEDTAAELTKIAARLRAEQTNFTVAPAPRIELPARDPIRGGELT